MKQYSFLQEITKSQLTGAATGISVGAGITAIKTIIATKEKYINNLLKRQQKYISKGDEIKANKIGNKIERIKLMSPMKFKMYYASLHIPGTIGLGVAGAGLGPLIHQSMIDKKNNLYKPQPGDFSTKSFNTGDFGKNRN